MVLTLTNADLQMLIKYVEFENLTVIFTDYENFKYRILSKSSNNDNNKIIDKILSELNSDKIIIQTYDFDMDCTYWFHKHILYMTYTANKLLSVELIDKITKSIFKAFDNNKIFY